MPPCQWFSGARPARVRQRVHERTPALHPLGMLPPLLTEWR